MTRAFTRTSVRLADGRELHYFDERPVAIRRPSDGRHLSPVPMRSEVRVDPLSGEPVIIAAHRQERTHRPAAEDCPLCPSRPGRATEVPARAYDVVSFENRFPAFADPGRCEVVCFTDDHAASFVDLSVERARLIIEAWAERTATLSGDAGIEQVFVFENRGEAIGVTLHHPHGQIYGYPFVAPRTAVMLETARTHRATTGRDLFADILDAERRDERVVTAAEHWTAFVPGAARWPVEVHLFPHRAVPDLAALDDGERDELATIYLDLLRRFELFHAGEHPMPYVAAWHQAPVRTGRDLVRLHLQLLSIQRGPDRLKYLAGSEAAMGAFLNDLVPEETARRLRDA